jgi:hypothetical protein
MVEVAELNRLWGGKLERVSFDPTAHSADLLVSIKSGEDVSRCFVHVRDVKRFEFRHEAYDRDAPWFYSELTEIAVDGQGNYWSLEAVLWSEACLLILEFGRIHLEWVS